MSQFLNDFIEAAGPDIDDETAKQLRDVESVILAGMDQMRKELGYKMGDVSWKRMGTLAGRLAVETVDYTPMEGLLVGSWMVASSRTQLRGDG